MTNVRQRSVQGSVAQGIRDAWDKFGEPSGRHVGGFDVDGFVCMFEKTGSICKLLLLGSLLPVNHLWANCVLGDQVDGRLES